MIRASTIFVAICMLVIATSLGMALYALLGLRASEAAIVALVTFSVLVLYNAVTLRMRDQTDVSGQIADLSRGTTDLAHQVAEFGRRLAAAESRIAAADSRTHGQVGPLAGEINELGVLVRQLAISVSAHEDMLTRDVPPVPMPAPTEPAELPDVAAQPVPTMIPDVTPPRAAPRPAAAVAPIVTQEQTAAVVKAAIEGNRIDLYLQPLVTLPQRKVRYYEAVSRLRDDKDKVLAASDFIAAAEQTGLMPRIDHIVMFRCVQVLRRLLTRNKDIGLFCNIAAATLRDTDIFAQCLDFLDANRALAPSFVLEFKQSTFRNLGPVESEHLAALTQRGFRFSVDNVTDLRIEPRELADRGVRFLKVPAALLLDADRLATSEIHSADLSDLLGRYGIDLIAERIEGERAVVDLLDYDVRYGQGFLFAPPRPLRPDSTPPRSADKAPPVTGDAAPAPMPPTPAAVDPAGGRVVGSAALARRAASSN